MRFALALALGVSLLIGLDHADAAFPTVSHDGRAYVELVHIAERLKGKLEVTPDRVYLRMAGRVITFTRNWSRVEIDGKPVVLDAPVRVERSVWLVPEAFVGRVLSRLSASSPAPAAPSAAGPAKPPALPAPAPAPPPRPAVPAEGKLEDVRFRSYPTFTRVVLETSAPARYRIEATGSKEARIRLSALGAETRTEEVRDGFVDTVHIERIGKDTLLRVVFEGAGGEAKVTTLTDPHRLLLDFSRPPERGPRETRAAVTPVKTIVLDAGHGGHDTGAVGPGGLMEKDLVLDVTRRVATLLEGRLPDTRVMLSRNGDYFVPLKDRTSSANRERADLFVSIHANAHRDVASAGVETYFLSSEATDSAARQVAALENGVVQHEKANGRNGNGRADVVKTILWDLAQSEFQQESSRLAEVVLDSMTRSLRIPNRGVKQAGFYVLGGAAMPAVLVEIGFVTNPKEERKLKDSKYRDEIARAIVAGIAEYKRHYDQRLRAAAR
jgi:N-acetylmuramoyl-L-alanine amidase